MVRTLHATPLSIEAYARYGGVISTNVVNPNTILVNGGSSRRTPEVVPTTNLYSASPSGAPGKTVLNASLASPKEVTAWAAEPGKRALRIKVLERHRFTTQSFVPMGGEVMYLVVATDPGDVPDLSEGKLKAFVARQEQGVCYAPGVWHAPMAVIDHPVSFAVIQHVNGVTDEDCDFFHLEEEIEIVF
ncbi:hypothetical protein BP6252_12608 [Coleophoma cylindrospora]|uniref:Ureidoglycolate hydrolase n=1 Tax=Coleophoma cylindrospora TaxID=1849047 RepID=A0A3D8QCQ5_9HELO|nr:hypothetical protein BP6252_12608 [Coleophoma cylindrospora]